MAGRSLRERHDRRGTTHTLGEEGDSRRRNPSRSDMVFSCPSKGACRPFPRAIIVITGDGGELKQLARGAAEKLTIDPRRAVYRAETLPYWFDAVTGSALLSVEERVPSREPKRELNGAAARSRSIIISPRLICVFAGRRAISGKVEEKRQKGKKRSRRSFFFFLLYLSFSALREDSAFTLPSLSLSPSVWPCLVIREQRIFQVSEFAWITNGKEKITSTS